MRIISGQYGGRRLITPKDQNIRPTSDKIRGAIFNALRSRNVVDNANVLDIFCGTGALGLEALSQGAKHCTFIDNNRTSLSLAKENSRNLDAEEQCAFILKDAARLESSTEKFDLIFLDPPYNKGLLASALTALQTNGWLSDQSFIVAETEKNFHDPLPPAYEILDARTYGETTILFLSYNTPV